MTSTGGSRSFNGQNIDRTRLVVPRLHQSVWASSQPAIMGSDHVLNRTGRTIQPLNQTNNNADDINHAVNNSAHTTSADGFMPTIPQYSDQAIPVHRSQSVVRQAATSPVQQNSQQVQPTVQPVHRQLSDADRRAIMERAALLRQQAREQAEAKAKADALAKMQAIVDAQNQVRAQRQANLNDLTAIMMRSNNAATEAVQSTPAASSARQAEVMSSANPFAPAAVNPVAANGAKAIASAAQLNSVSDTAGDDDVSADVANSANLAAVDQTGAAAVAQPNIFQRLAGAKVTISFKFNKQRFLTVLRYVAVAVIVAASGYLAWDTYMTNQSVKNSFDGSGAASAMSISGTNPATADQTAISQQDMLAYTVPSDQPRYIRIPSINVNARVMSVGVNSRGNIDTPANLNDTAWYDGSAKPGQEGQVFVDGHTSFSSAIYAAFNDLPKLQQGDLITIERGDGQQINYHVTEVKTVDADKVDMGEALNPPEGAKRGLTLMTCTGTFNYRTQTADKRLIVYAVQE